MGEDFMCQASDGNSGADGIACGSSIDPRGDATKTPMQDMLAEFLKEIRDPKVRLGTDRQRNGFSEGTNWGSEFRGYLADLIEATPAKTQIEEQAASPRSDEVDAGNKSASLTHQEKAREIALEWFDQYDQDYRTRIPGIIAAISSALLTVQKQERERCAKIAESSVTFYPGLPSHHENNIRVGIADRIASAIRQGDDNAS